MRLAHDKKYLMVDTFGKHKKPQNTQAAQPWTLFTNAFFTVDYYEKLEHLRNLVKPDLSPWEKALIQNGVLPASNTYLALSNDATALWAVERAIELAEHAIVALNALPPALGTAFIRHVDVVLHTHLKIVLMRLDQSEISPCATVLTFI